MAVGSSGFGAARVVLGPGQDGNHVAESSEPFGISVYGYGHATSYWYPGGLDLAEANALLLRKVEELTLHTIEQDKALRTLTTRLDDLEAKADALEVD